MSKQSQFLFKVTGTTELASRGLFVLDGVVEAGVVHEHSRAIVAGQPDRCVVIRSVALINRAPRDQTITLTIEKPNFPLVELRDAILVGE